MRIGAKVMSCPRMVVLAFFTEIKNTIQHTLNQFRVIKQVQWGRRISNVYRVDEASAVVLLGKPQYFSFWTLYQRVRSNALSISQRTQMSIHTTASLGRLVIQLLI